MIDAIQHVLYDGYANLVALWQIGYFSSGVHQSEHMMNILSRFPRSN